MAAVDLIATARNDEFAARVMFITLGRGAERRQRRSSDGRPSGAIDYAGRCIRGTDNPKNIAAHVISCNASIQLTIESDPLKYGANVPDGDIQFALATIWTARANAFEGVAG